jgi:hypothetical protein
MTRFTFTGRAVQGDPMKAGPQRKDKAGVLKFRKDGEPDAPFFYAIAIPKDPAKRFVIDGNPSYEEEKAKIDAAARAAWPNMFNPQYQRPAGLQFEASLPMDCSNPKFANKIQDGDGYDESGKPNNLKEGWAGCWVVKVSNGFAPKVYEWSNGWVELTPHSERKIKLGDYVTVSGTCETNQSTESPGMYMNFDTVSFEQEGELIVAATAVDPNQALGARGGNGAPAAGQSNGAAGTSGSGTASGAAGDQPYSGYREDAAPPPPGDDAPPPPSGPTMTAKAGGKTYESFTKAGWTDDQLRTHGYIA